MPCPWMVSRWQTCWVRQYLQLDCRSFDICQLVQWTNAGGSFAHHFHNAGQICLSYASGAAGFAGAGTLPGGQIGDGLIGVGLSGTDGDVDGSTVQGLGVLSEVRFQALPAHG